MICLLLLEIQDFTVGEVDFGNHLVRIIGMGVIDANPSETYWYSKSDIEKFFVVVE